MSDPLQRVIETAVVRRRTGSGRLFRIFLGFTRPWQWRQRRELRQRWQHRRAYVSKPSGGINRSTRVVTGIRSGDLGIPVTLALMIQTIGTPQLRNRRLPPRNV